MYKSLTKDECAQVRVADTIHIYSAGYGTVCKPFPFHPKVFPWIKASPAITNDMAKTDLCARRARQAQHGAESPSKECLAPYRRDLSENYISGRNGNPSSSLTPPRSLAIANIINHTA